MGNSVTANGLYRRFRNDVRELALRESLYVIWAYIQYLQIDQFEIPGDIEVSNQLLEADLPQTLLPEWALEQIAREVVKSSGPTSRRSRSLKRWDVLSSIAQSLLDLEEEIYTTTSRPDQIHFELMRLSHRQLVWQQQRYGWSWAIRYFKILNTVKINAISEGSLGLTIPQVFLIGMTFVGMFIQHPRALRRLNIELPGIAEHHVERFLELTCLKWDRLRERLRAEHSLDEQFSYRYSSLRAFPLIQISHLGVDEIACPVPVLLFWRFTTGLYYSLREFAGFPTALGESFQIYVGEVLAARVVSERMSIIPEAEYHVGRNRKDTVDWILLDNDAVAFIECKAMRLTWASKAGLSDLCALHQDIRKLAGAIVQIYRTVRDYRAGRYPSLAFDQGRTIYPVLVTLEDWYMFGTTLPVRLDEAVKEGMQRADIPTEWLDEMPFSVLSVDEFERAAGIVSETGIGPFISRKVRNPEFRRWTYHSYYTHEYAGILRTLPRLFRTEYEEMFEEFRGGK